MNAPVFLRVLGETIVAKYLTFRIALSMRVAEFYKRRHRQHWQAGQIGGGAVSQLGFMTQAEAVKRVKAMAGDDDPIAFIDFERGFIAYGRHPGERR